MNTIQKVRKFLRELPNVKVVEISETGEIHLTGQGGVFGDSQNRIFYGFVKDVAETL